MAELDSAIEALIIERASAVGLPPEIVRAMVLQESGGNPWACRYEPGFFRRYLEGKPLNFVPPGYSEETERTGRATSWGLLQVMGETARCNGFRGWLPQLCDPETGLTVGCIFLGRLRDRFFAKGGWTAVVRAYNGGPGNAFDPANTYPDRVRARCPGGSWPRAEVSHG